MDGISPVDRLKKIEEDLAQSLNDCNRDRSDVLLLGVSKYQSTQKMRVLLESGFRAFGESYVSELLSKQDELKDESIDWHYVGRLQTNKVRKVVGEVSLIHSVDKLSLVEEIDKRASLRNCRQPLLIQVNIEKEPSKAGIYVEDGPAFLGKVQCLQNVEIRGLMSMPSINTSEKESRSTFAQTRSLLESWRQYVDSTHSFSELSMGTSHDYLWAVKEGATIIRLGTVLFGEREKR